MAFYHRYENDSNAMLQFLKDFDRLAYGLFILRMRRDPRINRYARVLDAIEAGGELSADAGGSLALTSQEKRDILRALNGQVYQKQTWRFTKPLLARLNNALAETPISDFAKATVEHVLPQTPPEDSQWLEIFPDVDDRDDWTHRLANLVLLSHKKNARAQNHDFMRKKTEYFSRYGIPSFALTTQVINKSEWTPSLLERRQEFLLDVLKTEWRLARLLSKRDSGLPLSLGSTERYEVNAFIAAVWSQGVIHSGLISMPKPGGVGGDDERHFTRSLADDGSLREVDFYLLPPDGSQAKCEVKLMGSGNPESADAVIARDSKVFVASTLSNTNTTQLDSLGVLWTELQTRNGFIRFQETLKHLNIPHSELPAKSNYTQDIERAIEATFAAAQ